MKPLNISSFAFPQKGRIIAKNHLETNHFIPSRYRQKSLAKALVFNLLLSTNTFTSDGGNPMGAVLAAARIF